MKRADGESGRRCCRGSAANPRAVRDAGATRDLDCGRLEAFGEERVAGSSEDLPVGDRHPPPHAIISVQSLTDSVKDCAIGGRSQTRPDQPAADLGRLTRRVSR